MTDQQEYKGRPCYIRQAFVVEYLDGLKPSLEVIAVLDDDDDESSRTVFFAATDMS